MGFKVNGTHREAVYIQMLLETLRFFLRSRLDSN